MNDRAQHRPAAGYAVTRSAAWDVGDLVDEAVAPFDAVDGGSEGSELVCLMSVRTIVPYGVKSHSSPVPAASASLRLPPSGSYRWCWRRRRRRSRLLVASLA